MQLHSIECHFGRLDSRFAFSPDGLTLVLEENEQGKTTLIEAIVAALYGYERNERAAGGLRERERYLPTDGRPCYVQLELTAAGRRLSVRRGLNGTATETVRVIDLDTAQDVTAELAPSKGQTSPGEELLELTREQFLKICLVRQGQIGYVGEAGTLTDRVLKIVDTSAGERTADAAIDALDDAMRQFEGITLKKGQIDTEIERLNKRLLDAQSQQQRLRAGRDAIDVDARRLHELEAQDREDAQAQERLLLLANRAEFARLQDDQQAAEARVAKTNELKAQVADLEQYRVVLPDAALRVEAVWNDLGEVRGELAATEEACTRAERDLTSEEERLQRMGTLAGWTGADRDEVVASRDRLVTALARHSEAETVWRDTLRNAGPEARALYERSHSPFDDLSDEDRRALLHYPEETAQLSLTVERLRSSSAISTEPGRSSHNTLVLALGGAVLLAGLGLLAVRPILAAVVVIAGAGILAAGWFLHSSRSVGEAAMEARVVTRRELADAEMRQRQLEAEGSRLASAVGAVNAAEAASALRSYLTAQVQAAELRAKQQLLGQASSDLALARDKIAELWQGAGTPMEPAAIGAAEVDRLLSRVDDALAQRERIEIAKRSLRSTAENRDAAELKVQATQAEWVSRCEKLGLADSEPQAAMEQSRAMVGRREQLDRVEGQLRLLDEEIRMHRPADPATRVQELNERIAAAYTADPAFASPPVDRPASAYLDERQAIQERREANQYERQALRDRVGRALDDFRTKMPEAIDTEHATARRLTQVQEYRDALALALTTLREVAQESHRTWSETLNTLAASSLLQLAPGYAEIKFGEQLEIRVLDSGGHTWSPADGQLSAGARDRIYLAARLALADYCSLDGDPLPLILDDPLVTSDDDRFEAAMRFLLTDVSARHQVILLSCHRQRHEALMRRDPELWQPATLLPLRAQAAGPV